MTANAAYATPQRNQQATNAKPESLPRTDSHLYFQYRCLQFNLERIAITHRKCMFEIEFDQRAFDKVIMNAITEQVTKKVEDAVGAANAGKMKVKIKGRDLKNLSMEVEGPEELIEKVRKVLQ